MNENKKNKREWVKTAAIIFLSIMLVLTFFSNTIMNYSLPEVATQYVQPDTITAKIRGNGIIESKDPYNVTMKGVRKVESVEVRVGDKVQKGDLLCVLTTEDSQELTQAKANLKAAQDAYDAALLTVTDAAVLQNGGKNVSVDTYKKTVIAMQQEIDAAEAEVEKLETDIAQLEQWGAALTTQISITPANKADTTQETKAVNDAKAAISAADLAIQAAINEQSRSKNEQAKIQAQLDAEVQKENGGDPAVVASLQQALTDEMAKEAAAKQTENDETVKKADAEYALSVAQIALDNKIASGDTSGELANLNAQLNDNTVKLFHARNDLAAKQAVVTEKKEALAEYTANFQASQSLNALLENISTAQAEVDKLEAEVGGSEILAPISGTIMEVRVVSGKETPYDGGNENVLFTMQPQGDGFTMSFSVTNDQAKRLSVGDIAEPVNAWRYDDMQIVLESIRPDRTNPAENKMLVFSISGENVVAGQSLNVSVGQKSAQYDLVVPNSAIREDNNGKFILIIEAKSSPIGTRYTANRVDVQVVASDDTKSAITGALYGYEYVITTSTKPIQPGQQVRLTEN